MVYLVVLIILYIEGEVAIACDWQCPSDKPYCSEVGCVFECPEPFYINGSTCVSDCGDRFVDENRRCVASCENNTFVKETLKQVVSVQYLEKMCISCNQSDQYVFNGSCVKVCPESARYIDKNRCVSQCPVDRLFKTNITIYGLIHSKCIAKCPWRNVEDDNFCRDSCPDNKVQFKSSCVEKCPSSSPFISQRKCVTKCPYYAVSTGYENRTCILGECPKSRPFVVNDTCIDKCPMTDPVIYFKITAFGYLRSYCVNTCDDGTYSFNNSCVDICPPNTVAVKNSCIEHCPSNTSYTCKIRKGYQCGERRTFGDYFDQYVVCVNTCPRNMLTWNQSCVYTCPYRLALFDNECTDTCPSLRPYIRNNTKGNDCNAASRCREVEAVLTCTQKCPAGSYILNNTCLSYCPYPLLHKDNTCVLTCPVSTPFVQNSTIDVEDWYYDSSYYYLSDRRYRKHSQRKTIQKCVSYCRNGMLILNQTCVKTCPDSHPYIRNRTCLLRECETKYSEKLSTGIICTDKCKPQQFIHNRTCVGMCPTTNVLFNGTCVDNCPESHLLTSRFVVGETCDKACTAQNVMQQCVEKCPEGLFEHENTCVEFCHTPLFTSDGKCVGSCPNDRPYTVAASITVANWKKEGNQLKKIKTNKEILKCEATCPPDKVLFRSQCSDRCSLNSWFITNGICQSDNCKTNYTFSTPAGIWCFDECPQDLFVHNDMCYLQCPNNLYSFGQKCINDCPSTHKITNDETIANPYNCSWSSDFVCTDSLRYVKQCRNECPKNKILHNSKCLDFCLKHTFVFNSSCVVKCPKSHPFAQPSLVNIEKWDESPDGTGVLDSEEQLVYKCTVKCADEYPLLFGNTCYKHCPKAAPYLDKNTCVEMCPGDKLLDIQTKNCVDECANDRGLFNFSCHYNCPERIKYIFNSHCVAACPSSHPVAMKENRFICQKSCGDSKVFKEGECVFGYECDDPMFEYDGFCLSRCPDGFVWLDNCKATLGAQIAIAVLVVVVLILIGFNRHDIMDQLHVLRLIYATEEELKQIQTQQIRLSPKRKDETEDEIPLRETFFHTGNEETHQMEVHAENTNNTLNIDNTRL